jgi:hypothetical protein
VRTWLHPEHLDLRGVKMSKSLGNVIGVPDLLARHGADAVRWFYATHHYRSKLPFGWDLLDQAVAGYQRIKRLVDLVAERLLAAPDLPVIAALGEYASQRPPELRAPRLRHSYTAGVHGEASERMIARFAAAMDDDLNVPAAMAALFDYVSELYAGGIEASADLPSLLSVYRCLTAHLAVFARAVRRLCGPARRRRGAGARRGCGRRPAARAAVRGAQGEGFREGGRDPQAARRGGRRGGGHGAGDALVGEVGAGVPRSYVPRGARVRPARLWGFSCGTRACDRSRLPLRMRSSSSSTDSSPSILWRSSE